MIWNSYRTVYAKATFTDAVKSRGFSDFKIKFSFVTYYQVIVAEFEIKSQMFRIILFWVGLERVNSLPYPLLQVRKLEGKRTFQKVGGKRGNKRKNS